MLLTISYVIAGLLFIACIYLSMTTQLLKNSNPSPNTKAKYSFSRVQLMWWTIIISCSYIILFATTEDVDLFNNSTLILLGIGLGTTATSSLINVSQVQSGKTLHQHDASKGLMTDILSDENGISMHRLQAVIFNILFGIVFVTIMLTKSKFPEFNSSELALMGISSGAYLALKTNENKTTPTLTPTPIPKPKAPTPKTNNNTTSPNAS